MYYVINQLAYNLNNNSKQILGSTAGANGPRYRAPSPQTSSLSKIGLGGSFKGNTGPSVGSSNNLKTQKWK